MTGDLNDGKTLLTQILPRLQKVKGPDKKGWYTSLCPFHNDVNTPNLRFTENGFRCMACGERGGLKQLASKLGFQLTKTSMPKSRIVAIYDYVDEKGTLLFQVVRYTPKDFRQRRPDGKGGFIWNLDGVRRVLYKLPELIACPKDETVFVVEGEKDVNNLHLWGLATTCNAGGAGKFTNELRDPLKGKNVVIIADKDEPGRRHAQQVAAILHGFAASIKIIEMPGDDVKDASDWIDAGGTKQALETLVSNTPQVEFRPTVDVNKRHMRDIVSDSWAALLLSNEPPVIFQRGRQLVDIVHDHKHEPMIRLLDKAGIKGKMDRIADYVSIDEQGKEYPARPPSDVLDDMIAAKEIPLPNLLGIIDVPIFNSEGKLCLATGYQPETEYFLQPSNRLTIRDVPLKPSEAEVSKAKAFILDELLVDFPFVDEADKCHAVVLLLLPFIRLLINGPTPLHLIESPTPGSGKGLLIKVLTIPAAGRGPAVMTEGRDEDEWRKRITSTLLEAPRFCLIDNIRGRLDSAALSAALTGDDWKDRILGHSRNVVIPIRNVWIGSANNPSLSLEMARRDVSIRIDPRVERPEERTGFKHKGLAIWARQHRMDLVLSALILVQKWIALGKPPGQEVLGSYEEYAETMGGIMQVVGIPGFLKNRERVYEAVDQEVIAWNEFCRAWWDEYQDRIVGADLLFDLSVSQRLLNQILGGRDEHAARTRLGMNLTSMRDRVIGEYRIRVCPPDTHNKTSLYRLERMARPVTPPIAGAAGGAGPLALPGKPVLDKCSENTENKSNAVMDSEFTEGSGTPRSPRPPRNEWEMEI